MTETQIQIAVVSYFRDMMQKLGGFVLFHPANGGLRTKREASKLRAMGVLAGVSDLVFLIREGKAILIELKAAKGSLNDNQKAFHGLVTALGHASYCITAKDGTEAIREIEAILRAHKVIK